MAIKQETFNTETCRSGWWWCITILNGHYYKFDRTECFEPVETFALSLFLGNTDKSGSYFKKVQHLQGIGFDTTCTILESTTVMYHQGLTLSMKIEKDLTQNEFRVLILGDGTMIMFSSFLSFAVLPAEHFLYKNGPNTSIPRQI